MMGAPIHPLPDKFVFAEIPLDLARRIRAALEE
jgi:hypothetical protein